MINKKSLILAFLIFLIIIPKAYSYLSQPDEGISHDNLTDRSMKMVRFSIDGNAIKEGNNSEDYPGRDTRYHFYNPSTGKGLFSIFEGALNRATKFYKEALETYRKGDKGGGWERLGHALHLLQDMASPSHVHNAIHVYQYIRGVGYEWWVSNNWETKIEPYLSSLPPGFLEPVEAGDMDGYIKTMAKYTHYGGFLYDGMLNIPLDYIDDLDCEYNASQLIPPVINLGAGLLNTFWMDVGGGGVVSPNPDSVGMTIQTIPLIYQYYQPLRVLIQQKRNGWSYIQEQVLRKG